MENIRLLAVIMALATIIAGCQNNNAAPNNRNTDRMINVNQTNEANHRDKSANEVAKHLADLASSTPNVNDATAVVAGPYAVVGIDVNSKIDRSKVGTIKYSVAESLKNDPYGKKAVVVADVDTVARLKEMNRQIRQGEPVGGILEELAAIVGRVMPEVPEQIDGKQPNPTETNQKQMPQDDKQKLDKQQNEQSNHYLNKSEQPQQQQGGR